MAAECIFCRIAEGEIPARIAFADEQVVAFHDVAPKAPTHVLVIPRRHVALLSDTGPEDTELLGRLSTTAVALARELGLSDGYRLVMNCGEHAGQSVFHLHLHLLGGRSFAWPPG
jgi:histidine triad (HIT) family protein